ncbi:hypothetical protein G7Z17_g3769 [Cylindrodendrum hubeiense]|uniref:Major facilitator superfamily (MFS) profile domain-containing protein n=1 Tax=Cylindrodendrum hubeiense TaxID=595255 RepID=A0A9P5LJ13_9HYPO|nr:hypothetical protein G7Z17_g3769 [Cylindrodendrum hubeiense]
MGLGVLENRSHNQHVPGTVILAEKESNPVHNSGTAKHGTGKHKDIILTPQPSNDPNDPLNWPYYKKVLVVLILVYGSCLCACSTGPLLNASLFVLSQQFNRPIGDITVLSGYQLLVAGASGPFLSAFSRKYGKRPVFVFSSFACLIGTIIGSASNSYSTLLAARVIQGLSLAAYESLVFTVVGDIFFVHERGFWTSVMAFTLTCVSNLSSVVAGKITFSLGWHYLFHILNACLGLQIILLLLFVPETSYIRHDVFGQTQLEVENRQDNATPKEETEAYRVENVEMESTNVPVKKSFLQEMAIFTGSYSDDRLIPLVIAPIVSCANLAALWTIVITGTITSFYVAVAYVIAQLFSPPPYLLSAAAVGYMSVGPFIGGALGSIAVGLVMDPLTIWLTKKNNGVYEPEFRLVTCVFGLLCGASLFGFGAVSQSQGNIYIIDFMWGLTLFGTAFIIGPCSTYALDAFRGMSNEIFIANVMFKNFLFYGYSYFVNNWTGSAGPVPPFFTFGGISLGLVATTAIVYVFGKRYRSFWHAHNILDKAGINTHPGI